MLRGIEGFDEQQFIGADARCVGELLRPEPPIEVAVLSAARQEVVSISEFRAAASLFRVACPEAALGRQIVVRPVCHPVGLNGGERIPFAEKVAVKGRDRGQDESVARMVDQHRVRDLGQQYLAAAPIDIMELDETVVDLLGVAVLFPERAVRVGKVIVDIHAIDGIFLKHGGERGHSVIGEAVGRRQTGGHQVAVGVHLGCVPPAIVETLPERPFARGGELLHARRVGVHEVRVGCPDEQHARVVHGL